MSSNLSAASLRARNYPLGPQWYCELMEQEITGDLAANDEGIIRRDPSAVIQVGEVYYTWYSRSTGHNFGFGTGDPNKKTFPWDCCDLWYATSRDGRHWEEQGMAVARGETGSYDDRSVFTPEILVHEGRYHLVYQVVQSPYRRRSCEHIAMAGADSPDGPWTKLPGPILEATQDGEWQGQADNRFLVKSKGSFDSHKVHDPCLLVYRDKFHLYYKGEPMGEEMFMGGRETKWGVAIADRIEGPYVRSEFNPVSNSGHEICVWPYAGGVAGLLTTDGPERNTLQWAADGINFEIKAYLKRAPEANGPFRTPHHDRGPLEGLRWGLCHDVGAQHGHIKRFEVDESLKSFFLSRTPYE